MSNAIHHNHMYLRNLRINLDFVGNSVRDRMIASTFLIGKTKSLHFLLSSAGQIWKRAFSWYVIYIRSQTIWGQSWDVD